MTYRPWGSVEWSLSLSNPKQWSLIGALGTEERSLSAWGLFNQFGILKGQSFAEILDVDSVKYRQLNKDLLALRRAEFLGSGGKVADITTFDLMSELFRIRQFSQEVIQKNSSIVLDITSLPKRFFFPILEALVKSANIRDLLITYTCPDSYASGALYEDIEPWKTLPGFGGRDNPDIWIAGVGFLAESLKRYIVDNPKEKIKVLVPFPAPLSSLRRTWQSVAELEQGNPENRIDKIRVDTLDMSAAFDRISSLAGKPAKNIAFAPFGPKPTSAAMCLYALQQKSSVHYPQPTVYHPEYSKGIKKGDPKIAVSSYWIKHDGEFLYHV
ncbi:hypothetical protein [Methylophilus sp. TWE2]|uniref:hypothetical protein n=1 Tax=Methylophilus sp. TWE2 TaxID=1662285 RepID=UPI000671404C|nr:hypothetical protein [Methylophilus sp. TWE2]AKR42003.1 hypothetical protein ACJ67_00075 [Methylophilus sp. TWE2]